MFERDHGPLEYQIGTARRSPTCSCRPRHRHLILRAALLRAYAAPPVLAETPARRRRTAGRSSRCGPRRSSPGPAVRQRGVLLRGSGLRTCPRSGCRGRRRSTDHPPGTRVWFATNAGMAPGDGSLAEWCAVPAADLVPISGDVPDAVVAAIGTSGIAAWMALTWRAGLSSGERVVVLGAIGTWVRWRWPWPASAAPSGVVAVRRSAEADERARACGAHDVVVVDPAEERVGLARRLVEAAGGPVDVVVDPVGEPAAAAVPALGPGGRWSISADRPAISRSSHRPCCAAGASASSATPTTPYPPSSAPTRYPGPAAGRAGVVSVDHRVLPWPTAARPGHWPAVPVLGSSSRSDPVRWESS